MIGSLCTFCRSFIHIEHRFCGVGLESDLGHDPTSKVLPTREQEMGSSRI